MNAKLCVAVVDDEAPVRTALGRLLRVADFSVSTFASGEDFLAALSAWRPDCVVLDIHMPGLSGLEVQSRLENSNNAVPVVLITASDEVLPPASEPGARRLLRKPFSADELIAAISAAAGAKR